MALLITLNQTAWYAANWVAMPWMTNDNKISKHFNYDSQMKSTNSVLNPFFALRPYISSINAYLWADIIVCSETVAHKKADIDVI